MAAENKMAALAGQVRIKLKIMQVSFFIARNKDNLLHPKASQ
jgi:hypothetical protein